MKRLLACLGAIAALLPGCEESCLGADGDCTVSTPCARLAFECSSPNAPVVRVLEEGDPIPDGIDALASPGDVILSNGLVTAVIDAIEHPHYVA
ncbi:MAG TPA: hypothetical protein VIL20_00570, partial [Sandaracinaceae bacterium]